MRGHSPDHSPNLREKDGFDRMKRYIRFILSKPSLASIVQGAREEI